jgi:hypothetical protein
MHLKIVRGQPQFTTLELSTFLIVNHLSEGRFSSTISVLWEKKTNLLGEKNQSFGKIDS